MWGPTFVDYHLRLPTLWKLYANPLMLCGRTAVMEAKKEKKNVAKTFFTVLFLSFPGSVAQYEATTTLGFSRKERPRRRPHSLSIPLQSVHAQKSHNILWKCFGHKRWRRWQCRRWGCHPYRLIIFRVLLFAFHHF